MANNLADSRDIRFVLFEMLDVDKINKYPKYSDLDRDVFEDVLTLAERIAVDYFYPSNSQGDKEGGAKYDPKTNGVTVPESVRAAYNAYKDAGFFKSKASIKEGGMGLPDVVVTACDEYFKSGNTTVFIYAGLTLGAAYLIDEFGTKEQKNIFGKKLSAGEWGGTMCLTEPEAGTDVGNIKMKAVKQNDGTYLLSGQKIFISAGEHDLTENIVHMTLARIEGHPQGTKGISAFIVPKFFANPDGSKGARNDVVCSGIEHKMGIKSSSTATLNFGDNNKCKGYLLGKEQEGMKVMFTLMNQARIETGMQALGQASTAYMHALTYAKNRKQGAHLTQMLNPNAPSVAIIEHPDVQRMLLWMKCYVEGMRMLAYNISLCMDISHIEEGEKAKEAESLIELLTPVIKAGISDISWHITSEAIQVYGGYGYVSEYPVEQFARDTKIFSIYEGTNGIQAMDLLFRKILMNKDQQNYKVWKQKVADTIANAKGIVEDKYIFLVGKGIKKLDEAFNHIAMNALAGKFLLVAMNATPFLQAMFMMVLAWLHLWSLTTVTPKLKLLTGDTKGPERQKIIDSNNEAAFYTGKVLSSQFYIGAEFPKYFGNIECILGGESAVIKTSPAIFTGALD